MLVFFAGQAISLVYGVLGFFLLWLVNDKSDAQLFFSAYTASFKTIISLGLILGTAMLVYYTQSDIPEIIEGAFTKAQLKETDYTYYKRRFSSRRISLTFSAEFIVAAFIIFSYCQFPLTKIGEALMLIAVCAEYGLAVYVGRKLMYAGMMLHSLTATTVTRNLFKERELDGINTYVNAASTLTIIFVYVHASSYYAAPFLYGSILGTSIKPFLILMPIIATPVLLIFNFYPRAVLRKLYSKSIEVGIGELRETLQDEKLSSYEKRSYLIEFDKMCRDELRYSLQLTLSDLPIGITILVLIVQSFLKT
ncbi:MAG TPA: hypothetical protein VGO47_07085 [Chlamydiales bacterium]|jgi:hypothetical protein|nr:hypothetical protein [Chlamydiales bacterium]